MQYSPDQYSIVKFIEENKHLDLKAIIKAAENEVDERVPPAKDRDDMGRRGEPKPPIDSLHRLPCLFGDGGAGRSTLSDIELVTTFSGEKNWSSMTTGSRVVLLGMMRVSNRSNRRERPLLIIFVVSGGRSYSTLRAARIL